MTRAPDPRAVRVAIAASMAHVDLAPMVVEPPEIPVVPAPLASGTGDAGERDGFVLLDEVPVRAHLDYLDDVRADLHLGGSRRRLLLGEPSAAGDGRGVIRREVVVDGWRIELEIESERRAALRDRARAGREASVRSGPTEVHAIIPGRVLSVSVVPGDGVVAGQQVLVVEAMKMQNELRAPRDGTIARVAVAPDQTIEIGDLLLVLE